MKQLREYSELKKILGAQVRSPRQVNHLFEADCEIVKVGPKNFITTSTDSLGEEISQGLYQEPETWAWLTVASSVSDHCASGATALGLTLSTQWAFNTPAEIKTRFFTAVKKACQKMRVPLLGGDSGYAQDHVMTSSILGHSAVQPLMRSGAKAGDYLVLADQKSLGVGPALALRFLLQREESLLPERIFRPAPSWQLAQKVRPLATAAIDTSDGLTMALYTLAQINNLGFEIHWSEKVNHPQALHFCAMNTYSPIMLWLGDLGDLQTLFVIPEKNLRKLPRTGLTVLGQLHSKKSYTLKYKNHSVPLPIDQLTQTARDTGSYMTLAQDLKKYLAPFS
ncbi:MAG TPA: AIR synthase related protein [Bdellovibrio sp.]